MDSLTGKSWPGENEDIPCSNSCFTRLLQDSLGENANLSVICSISLDSKYYLPLSLFISTFGTSLIYEEKLGV